MKNSSFIKAFVSVLLLAAPVLGRPATEDRFQPKGSSWRIEDRCSDEDIPAKCQTVATDGRRRIVIQRGGSPASNITYKRGLYRMDYACGTACSITYFFRPPNHVSRAFSLVGAVDAKRDYVLSLDENPVKAYEIFGKSTPVSQAMLHTQSEAPAASGVISQADLVGSSFVVTYQDDDGITRRSEIPLPR